MAEPSSVVTIDLALSSTLADVSESPPRPEVCTSERASRSMASCRARTCTVSPVTDAPPESFTEAVSSMTTLACASLSAPRALALPIETARA